MHPTAWLSAHLFFLYLYEKLACFYPRNGEQTAVRILDFGSYDVNGNMLDAWIEMLNSPLVINGSAHDGRLCNTEYNYTGLDNYLGPNVNTDKFDPLWSTDITEQFDLVLSSSVFEHDDTFWESFKTLVSVVKPGGFLYINVPSSVERHPIHRYPVDNWRFMPDAAYALTRWLNREKKIVDVLFSNIADNTGELTMAFRKRKYTKFSQRHLDVQEIDQMRLNFETYFTDIKINTKRFLALTKLQIDQEEVDTWNSDPALNVPIASDVLLKIPHYCSPICCRADKEQLRLPLSLMIYPHVLVPVRVDMQHRSNCLCQADFVLTKNTLMDEALLEESLQLFCDTLTCVSSQLKDAIIAQRDSLLEDIISASSDIKYQTIDRDLSIGTERTARLHFDSIDKSLLYMHEIASVSDFVISLDEADPLTKASAYCLLSLSNDGGYCPLSIIFSLMDHNRKIPFRLDFGFTPDDWSMIRIDPNIPTLPVLLENICRVDSIDFQKDNVDEMCLINLRHIAQNCWYTFLRGEQAIHDYSHDLDESDALVRAYQVVNDTSIVFLFVMPSPIPTGIGNIFISLINALSIHDNTKILADDMEGVEDMLHPDQLYWREVETVKHEDNLRHPLLRVEDCKGIGPNVIVINNFRILLMIEELKQGNIPNNVKEALVGHCDNTYAMSTNNVLFPLFSSNIHLTTVFDRSLIPDAAAHRILSGVRKVRFHSKILNIVDDITDRLHGPTLGVTIRTGLGEHEVKQMRTYKRDWYFIEIENTLRQSPQIKSVIMSCDNAIELEYYRADFASHLRKNYNVSTHFFSDFQSFTPIVNFHQKGLIKMLVLAKTNYIIGDTRSSFLSAIYWFGRLRQHVITIQHEEGDII